MRLYSSKKILLLSSLIVLFFAQQAFALPFLFFPQTRSTAAKISLLIARGAPGTAKALALLDPDPAITSFNFDVPYDSTFFTFNTTQSGWLCSFSSNSSNCPAPDTLSINPGEPRSGSNLNFEEMNDPINGKVINVSGTNLNTAPVSGVYNEFFLALAFDTKGLIASVEPSTNCIENITDRTGVIGISCSSSSGFVEGPINPSDDTRTLHSVRITVVSEPATLSLLGLGFAGIAFLKRRTKA